MCVCVNNQSYRKVKYVHAYIDIFLTEKGKKMNLLPISSSQKEKCPHTSINKFVYTQTKVGEGGRSQQQQKKVKV